MGFPTCDEIPASDNQRCSRSGTVLLIVWVLTLLVSNLPDIFFNQLGGGVPAQLNWAKLFLLVLALGASFIWNHAKELKAFMLILGAFHVLNWVGPLVYNVTGIQLLLAGESAFVRDLAAAQIPRFTIAVVMLLFGRILFGSFKGTFFAVGRLDAPAAPIPYVLTRPPKWKFLALMIAGYMCAGLLLFMFVFGKPPEAGAWKAVLPLIPFVLLFAASNAFGEEVLFRAPWLAALEKPVGVSQGILLTATVFGLAHFNGIPYGIVGVIMAFVPGYLMGKAMVETRGFFWAWFIHICLDILILTTLALGSVTMGGQ